MVDPKILYEALLLHCSLCGKRMPQKFTMYKRRWIECDPCSAVWVDEVWRFVIN